MGDMSEPSLYDREIVKSITPKYWTLREFKPCQCPHCDEEAHWYNMAGTPDVNGALEWAYRYNIKMPDYE